MKKLSALEFQMEYVDMGEFMPEYVGAKYFYLSENDECPYIGIEYENGEIWIFGLRMDIKVTMEELEWYLSQT